AVIQANATKSADTINLAAGDYYLSLGQLDVCDDLTIIGTGPGGTGQAQPTRIIGGNGGADSRVFEGKGAGLTLSGMYLGGADLAPSVAQGGLIRAVGSTVDVDNALLTGFATAVHNNGSAQGSSLTAQGGVIYAVASNVTFTNAR